MDLVRGKGDGWIIKSHRELGVSNLLQPNASPKIHKDHCFKLCMVKFVRFQATSKQDLKTISN
jgi:hypothetical protein